MTDHEAQVIAHVRHRLDALAVNHLVNSKRLVGTQANLKASADELNQLSLLLASIQEGAPKCERS